MRHLNDIFKRGIMFLVMSRPNLSQKQIKFCSNSSNVFGQPNLNKFVKKILNYDES